MILCKRCEHQWTPRSDDRPRECPRCRSTTYDQERTIKGLKPNIRYALLQEARKDLATDEQLAREQLRADIVRIIREEMERVRTEFNAMLQLHTTSTASHTLEHKDTIEEIKKQIMHTLNTINETIEKRKTT